MKERPDNMQTHGLFEILKGPGIGRIFSELYGRDEKIVQEQIRRYERLVTQFQKHFSGEPAYLFSSPGRTEIGGNHTDHNSGRVLAASVNLDTIAAVSENGKNEVKISSETFPKPFVVDLDELKPQTKEEGTTTSLIRGIAARFKELGYKIGGFNAFITSDVLIGSGLSSSASVEVLIGTIFNSLFNSGKINSETIAVIGQYAENNYFNKPCGLMDQMTIAVGGIVAIDFKNSGEPAITKVDFDLSSHDYSILVVDTGGNHADLTEDYASIPREMKSVAHELGKLVCRDITLEQLLDKIPMLREKPGDRAVLRAMHFIMENERVVKQVAALENDDLERFLELINESGSSSFKWLQNCYTPKNPEEQGITLALALTEQYLMECNEEGACRVHGGGFAGTIQVFMPNAITEEYIQRMEKIFGHNSVEILNVRSFGPLYLNAEI
jgi:galactokinase